MTALTAFSAGAAAYDHANHAAAWAHHHAPLLLGLAVLAGTAAALWLRCAITADQRAWQDSTRSDPPEADDDLSTCRGIWAAGTARRRNTRKENPR